VILVLVAALVWLSPAHAQTGFQLAVSPLLTEVPIGTDFTLELNVEEGLDLNAFDVTLVYDPEVLRLVDWAYGDYFANLASMSVINQPGELRVAATQVASAPVSGDGLLLSLSFDAKAEGFSPVDITRAEFADSDGNKLEPDVVHGQVLVTLAPTYTPTGTSTPTATATPTRTLTPTRTSTLAQTVTATGTKTGTPTSTLAQTETAEVFTTQTPTSAFTETPSGQTGTATGTALAGTADSRLTPTITRSPWPVLEASVTNIPQTSVIPMNDNEEPIPTPDQQDHDSRNLLNGLLWGVLLAGLITFMVLVVLILRRRKQKEEDLLL
jgi:hypothetical protein